MTTAAAIASDWPLQRRAACQMRQGMKAIVVAMMMISELLLAPGQARADGLIADLSQHLIAITTAFSGSNVLLFGALETEGSEIAVVVRGPNVPVTVRRKSQVGPIWVNTDSLRFDSVPSFYMVAASAPLADLADPDTLRRHDIGTDKLNIPHEDAGSAEFEAYREALIRRKQEAGLYSRQPIPVQFLGGRLFRATLAFPANVPPGNYTVEIFEFAEGDVVSAQRSVLVVSKVGTEAELFDLAKTYPALYGLVSILMAMAAGWAASAIFKRS